MSVPWHPGYAVRWLKLAALLSLWALFFALVVLVHVWTSVLRLPNRWKTVSRLSRTFTFLVHAILNIKVTVVGEEQCTESGGYVIICNHVSYVDGIVLGSMFPIVFVSKREVKRWPIIGPWNMLCGTIFINRQRKNLVASLVKEMRGKLKQEANILLFPEGTSTNGPFQTAPLAAPLRNRSIIVPVTLAYKSIDNEPVTAANRDLLYWYGDMEFVPHFWKLLSLRSIELIVSIQPKIECFRYKDNCTGRKKLAIDCYNRVLGRFTEDDLMVFLFFSASSYKGVPYILPMLPPLAILIARYLAAAWESPRLAGVPSGSFTLLVVLSLLVIAGLAGPQHYLERYSNWPALEVPAEGTVASARVKESGDLSALTPYIHARSAILIMAGVSALVLWLGNRRAFRWGFLSLTLAWALFLVVLNSSLPLLDQRRSIKALATVLKSQLRPSDEVASYHAYYQDLPVYLQRPVAVVSWKGNLQFGLEVNERSGGWMTDDASFWKRWNSPETVYMLTEQGTYDKLRSESSFKFRVVAQGLYDVLLSNKTT